MCVATVVRLRFWRNLFLDPAFIRQRSLLQILLIKHACILALPLDISLETKPELLWLNDLKPSLFESAWSLFFLGAAEGKVLFHCIVCFVYARHVLHYRVLRWFLSLILCFMGHVNEDRAFGSILIWSDSELFICNIGCLIFDYHKFFWKQSLSLVLKGFPNKSGLCNFTSFFQIIINKL